MTRGSPPPKSAWPTRSTRSSAGGDHVEVTIRHGPDVPDEFVALVCEFKTDIAAYLETYTAAGYPKTLADLIAFNEANQDIEGGPDNPDLPWNNRSARTPRTTGGRRSECAAHRAALTPAAQAAITRHGSS